MNPKPFLTIVFVIVIAIGGFGQSATPVSDTAKVFIKVEHPAEFPGGSDGWRRYLEENLHYPKKAFRKQTQGVVRIQFLVMKDGSVAEVVALNDPGDGIAEEAIRIIKNGPKWKPADQDGRRVIYRHIQSITFRLE